MRIRLYGLGVLLFGLLALFGTAGHAEARDRRPRVALAWVFAIHDTQEGSPYGKVFLNVGGRRELVEAKADYHFNVVGRGDYATYAVPPAALCACTGWWGGGGEDLYVVRRGNRLKVFRRWADEQAPAFPYRLIRSFSLP